MDLKEPFPILQVGQLEDSQEECPWLIEFIWAKNAVGILGGPPKCCKSWMGLDMAVSVASGTPCLGQFTVSEKAPVLIYLAEDTLSDVRIRINALCEHRKMDINKLDLFSITIPSLRLDLEQDQLKLRATLNKIKPRLLLLDPLVRLHRLDENSSADISRLLGFLRELQRSYHCAIVLVHHASKKHRAQPGQALRGSSDLHAFGDSNAYMARQQDHFVLTLEQRRAKALPPIELELVSGSESPHLQVVSPVQTTSSDLRERILVYLQHSETPQTRLALRSALKVNNKRLGDTLIELENQGLILKQSKGWFAVKNHSDYPEETLEEQVSSLREQ